MLGKNMNDLEDIVLVVTLIIEGTKFPVVASKEEYLYTSYKTYGTLKYVDDNNNLTLRLPQKLNRQFVECVGSLSYKPMIGNCCMLDGSTMSLSIVLSHESFQVKGSLASILGYTDLLSLMANVIKPNIIKL